MKKLALFLLFFIIIVGAGGFLFVSNWYNSAIYSKTNISEVVEFEVKEGESFTAILSTLESEKIIQSKLAVQIYMELEKLNPVIRSGKYSLQGEYSVDDLISTFGRGVQKASKFVTIKEAQMSEKTGQVLAQELAEFTKFNIEEFNQIVFNPDNITFKSEIAAFLNTHKPAGQPLRGFLYPDTYRFDEGMTTQEVIEMMLTNLITKFNENNLQDLIGKNQQIPDLYSAITLASIVEKESSAKDNKQDIAAVFTNRIREGISLGSDATINFVTGKSDAAPLLSDTRVQSEYNTYINLGLPPTPINNPSIAAIVSSFNPNQHGYYFFFHDDSGNTYYSSTLFEHNTKACQIRGC